MAMNRGHKIPLGFRLGRVSVLSEPRSLIFARGQRYSLTLIKADDVSGLDDVENTSGVPGDRTKHTNRGRDRLFRRVPSDGMPIRKLAAL